MEQISFIAGVHSLNEQDLRKSCFSLVPEASIESIGSKLDMRIFDEYANILKYMYSIRFNGVSTRVGTSLETQPTPETDTPSLISTLKSGRPDKFRKRRKGSKEKSDKFSRYVQI